MLYIYIYVSCMCLFVIVIDKTHMKYSNVCFYDIT